MTKIIYYKIYIEFADKFGIEDRELSLFCFLYYVTRIGPYNHGADVISQTSHCGKPDAILRTLKKLKQKGLIDKTQEGYIVTEQAEAAAQDVLDAQHFATTTPQMTVSSPQNTVDTPQIAVDLKESSKENIINNNKELTQQEKDEIARFGFTVDFISFWDYFDPDPKFYNRKQACFEVWIQMTKDWQKAAEDAAFHHQPHENPYFWLKEELFLKDVNRLYTAEEQGDTGDTPSAETPPQMEWFDGRTADSLKTEGERVVCALNPVLNKFQFCRRSDAEAYNLQISYDF